MTNDEQCEDWQEVDGDRIEHPVAWLISQALRAVDLGVTRKPDVCPAGSIVPMRVGFKVYVRVGQHGPQLSDQQSCHGVVEFTRVIGTLRDPVLEDTEYLGGRMVDETEGGGDM